MNRVSVELLNCYGIKKLKKQFDFSQDRVYAIYAPNGAMKSSLAQNLSRCGDWCGINGSYIPGAKAYEKGHGRERQGLTQGEHFCRSAI